MTRTIWKSSVVAAAVLLSLCGVARAGESQLLEWHAERNI